MTGSRKESFVSVAPAPPERPRPIFYVHQDPGWGPPPRAEADSPCDMLAKKIVSQYQKHAQYGDVPFTVPYNCCTTAWPVCITTGPGTHRVSTAAAQGSTPRASRRRHTSPSSSPSVAGWPVRRTSVCCGAGGWWSGVLTHSSFSSSPSVAGWPVRRTSVCGTGFGHVGHAAPLVAVGGMIITYVPESHRKVLGP